MQARQTRRVFGSLALSVIEVSGNGNDHAVEFAGQRFGRPGGQRFEDIGGDANRVQQAAGGLDHRQAVFTGLQLIRQMRVTVLNIGEGAPHHPLHGADGIGRILSGVKPGVIADGQPRSVVVHHRRQQIAALMIGQSLGLAATHGSHQRIGGAQVDTGRQTTLVRRGAQAGLTNL